MEPKYLYRVQCIMDDGRSWYRKQWYDKAGTAKSIATRKNNISIRNNLGARYFIEKHLVTFVEVI